jgi:Transcription factor zinc-finger
MNIREDDPFVRKLLLKERAEEDIFFAARDRELIGRLHQGSEDEQRRRVQELSRMRCPECGAHLARADHLGVTIEECPVGHGMWLTGTEMLTLARRERNSWIGRYFYRPRPVV